MPLKIQNLKLVRFNVCAGFFCVLVLVSGCAVQTPVEKPSPTFALAQDSSTPLGKLSAVGAKKPIGESGFSVLDTGQQAFLARANLIEAATRSIDAQYYIWNSDASGRYLARRLIAAADRGVRVRLLLDDMNVKGRDSVLSGMSRHPNIEVRLYNPASVRQGVGKNLALLRDFQRINRRMHNKTFIADATLAIVGGRNIGDEYFDLHAEMNHRDRDVMALGPVVKSIASNFDDYWNSPWSIGMQDLAGKKDEDTAQTLPSSAQWDAAVRKVIEIHQPSQNSSVVMGDLKRLVESMIWARAELIYDPPVTDMSEETDQPMRTADALREAIKAAKSEVLIESAYLILAKRQLEIVKALKQEGVRLAAITNTLASNDLTANHAGYARWRKDMVESGIELYEWRPDADGCLQWIKNPGHCQQGGVSLHAKSAVFDRKVLYIGSFNFNLRSAYLNGETILIIYSPELSQRVADDIALAMKPENSWQVTVSDGRLAWIDREGDIINHEPGVNWWRRFKSRLISLLPIEKYL